MAYETEPQFRPLVTRAAAIVAGLRTYNDGHLCKNGHVSGRLVSSGQCLMCKREYSLRKKAKRLSQTDVSKTFTGNLCSSCGSAERYTNSGSCVVCTKDRDRERHHRDREKRLALNKKWRTNNAERKRRLAQEYRMVNLERERTREKLWRMANIDAVRTRDRLRSKRRDPEKERARGRIKRQKYPGTAKAGKSRRRALEKGCEGSHTRQEIETLYKKQNGKCMICLVKLNGKYHPDHRVPLANGGTNWISNIQLTCKRCNLRKGAKDPLNYAREIGLLLL